jgi:AAA+ superfamily predicted ATPase
VQGRPGSVILPAVKHTAIIGGILAIVLLAAHPLDVSLTGTGNGILDGLAWCVIWTASGSLVAYLYVAKRRRGAPADSAALYVGHRAAWMTWAGYLAATSLLGTAGVHFPGNPTQIGLWGRPLLSEVVFVLLLTVGTTFALAASDPYPAQLGLPGLRLSRKAETTREPAMPVAQPRAYSNAPQSAPTPAPAAPPVPPGVEFIRKPDTTFKDVVGLELAKREIREAMQILGNPKLGLEYGLKPLRGMLLEGAPGTGKTMFARAVAGEYNASFISLEAGAMKDKWVGDTEKNVRALFDFCRSQPGQVILFIDEVDQLLPDRAQSREVFDKSMVNAFLTQMDGIDSSRKSPLILAATNLPQAIDPAAKRPGRFDRIVHITLPTLAERGQLLRMLFGKRATVMSSEVHAAAWAARLEGWSPAKLTRLVADAAQAAWRANGKITNDCLEQAYALQVSATDT